MHLKKAVQLYEKAAQLGNIASMKNLALIYETGKKSVDKDLEKCAHFYFQIFKLGDKSFLEKFLKVLNSNKIEWREEYHLHWKSPKNINRQILVILLVSKFRKQSSVDSVTSFSKVIAMKLIKFLCHMRQAWKKYKKKKKKYIKNIKYKIFFTNFFFYE